MSIQSANRFVKYPRCINENVLVQVESFIFPVDFVVIDMSEDVDVLLILGRPFLTMIKAIIEVGNRKLTLRLGYERVVFRLPDVMHHSLDHDDTFLIIDVIDLYVSNYMQEFMNEDALLITLQPDGHNKID